MDLPAARCLNCDHEISGEWCASCGQRRVVRRLDTRDLLRDLVTSLVDVDAALPRTVRDLTLRPGAAARDYVEGRRRRYMNPLQYILFAIAILLLAFALRNVRPSELAPVQARASVVPEAQDAVEALRLLIDRNMQVLILTTVPFFAWAGGLLHRRLGWTFAERCVLFTYVVAHAALVGSVVRMIVGAGSPLMNGAVAALSLVYYTWATRGFFGSTWMRAVASVLAGYAAWIVVVAGVIAFVAVAAVVLALTGAA